ncbi:unnamed protein product, partial [Iphiclides podalirius]
MKVLRTFAQDPAAGAAQLGQVQIGGGRRERHGAGADPRRDAAHAAVQVHAALGAGGGRAARAAPGAAARARVAALARQARAGQLRVSPRGRRPPGGTPPPAPAPAPAAAPAPAHAAAAALARLLRRRLRGAGAEDGVQPAALGGRARTDHPAGAFVSRPGYLLYVVALDAIATVYDFVFAVCLFTCVMSRGKRTRNSLVLLFYFREKPDRIISTAKTGQIRKRL